MMKHYVALCTLLVGLVCAAVSPLTPAALAKDEPAVKVTYRIPANLSTEEKKWYRTFQEGNMLADGWVDISKDILARMPATKQPEQQKNLLQLGDKIGREWAKHNDERKIDTDMLKKWGKELKDASRKNPEALNLALNNINRQVDSLVRR